MAIIRKPMQEIAEASKSTDWSHYDAMTDEEAHQAALSDPDAQPISDEQWKSGRQISFAKHLRYKIGLTQEEFATRYGIPLGTLRDWEQHRSEPDQASKAYLKVIAADPEHAARALAS